MHGGGEWLAMANDEEALVERLALEAFLESLPCYLRRVAELYSEGYRYTEIAAQLGVSVGTVQGYLGRIRALGRAFFGVDGNKRVLDVVIRVEVPQGTFQTQTKWRRYRTMRRWKMLMVAAGLVRLLFPLFRSRAVWQVG
jgi:uncharacterized protein YerC